MAAINAGHLPFVVCYLCFASCSSLHLAKEPIKVDNLASRIEAGTADAQFDRFLVSGLARHDLNTFYYPQDDIVCIEYRIRLTNYSLFWDEENRRVFTEALNRYKEDYSLRNLGKNYLRTKRQYGTVNGLIMWNTVQRSAQGISYPDLEFGYYFKNKMPYFAITQREAANVSEVNEQDKIPNTVIYFTRAQAEALAGIFEPGHLRGLRRLMKEESASSAILPGIETEY